ncbi:hypothetical protein [Neosynechococcus sphagnicola]|uniref:hypothetical protein n=1 Tax=Neosynechococcus sphagnicola TaxID=1501145 RepID=UPI0012DFEA15|nr:hypothetical protein [Neosynechococcus sphagnicola]
MRQSFPRRDRAPRTAAGDRPLVISTHKAYKFLRPAIALLMISTRSTYKSLLRAIALGRFQLVKPTNLYHGRSPFNDINA